MTLTAIKYDEEEHVLSLLDQRALPTTTTYIQCTTSHQVTALLPTGRFFGLITQKGRKFFFAAGLKKSAAEFGPILNIKGRKGAELLKCLFFFYFFLKAGKS
jgi:hypothetical protein